MGMALTYARRYSLFALVGIAGEDDLDAPDLQTSSLNASESQSGTGRTPPGNRGNGHSSGRNGVSSSNATKTSGTAQNVVLGPHESAALRDRLLGEVNAISSADEGALWAYCNLRAKNGLTTADARSVETAFDAKLAAVSAAEASPNRAARASAPSDRPARTGGGSTKHHQQKRAKEGAQRIDKSVLTFPEPRRIRDREHVRFVAKQPCLVCGRLPSDSHHIRHAQPRALARKVSDEFTVPLCRVHHREAHRCGDEAKWWERIGIDPAPLARELWLQTHPQLRVSNNLAATESATSPAEPQSAAVDAALKPDDRMHARARKGKDYKRKPIAAVAHP
jgi:hypothetical protein